MNALEVIADAMMHHEGWGPGTTSNRNRNPGNLRDSKLKSGEDSRGYAIFPDLPTGYIALLNDLKAKFTGHTSTGLTPDSTFLQFIQVYAPTEDNNNPASYFADVVRWFKAVTGIPITETTQLKDIWQPE